jgi:hypothetical protein
MVSLIDQTLTGLHRRCTAWADSRSHSTRSGAATKGEDVKRRACQVKLQAAGVMLALVLLAPAAAYAISTGGEAPARAGQHAAFTGGVSIVDAEQQGRLRQADGAAGRAVQPRPVEAVGRSELGWPDAVIGIGFMIGVLCLALWIDVAVGAVAEAAAVFGRGAMLVTWRRRPGRRRALEPITGQERSSTG